MAWGKRPAPGMGSKDAKGAKRFATLKPFRINFLKEKPTGFPKPS
jgi:hypothetical protein